MTSRLFAAALVAALAATATRAADDDNPYKNAKVGDFATYKMTVKLADKDTSGTVTQTIAAKTDKEVTVKVTGKLNGTDIPAQEQKIDITKPYDPSKSGALPPGAEVTVDKLKEGKEKVKVGDKTYETNWTTYKVTAKVMGLAIEAKTKVWFSKDVPLGMVKMETTAEVAGMKLETSMELTETGNKK